MSYLFLQRTYLHGRCAKWGSWKIIRSLLCLFIRACADEARQKQGPWRQKYVPKVFWRSYKNNKQYERIDDEICFHNHAHSQFKIAPGVEEKIKLSRTIIMFSKCSIRVVPKGSSLNLQTYFNVIIDFPHAHSDGL